MGAKKDRIIYIDDEEYVWCSMEQDFVIHSKFQMNDVGEYKMFCSDCSSKTYEERHQRYIGGSKKRRDLDIEECKMLLKTLGYDIDSEFTIHQQFLIKHNLI
jgi:hypothetical protein